MCSSMDTTLQCLANKFVNSLIGPSLQCKSLLNEGIAASFPVSKVSKVLNEWKSCHCNGCFSEWTKNKSLMCAKLQPYCKSMSTCFFKPVKHTNKCVVNALGLVHAILDNKILFAYSTCSEWNCLHAGLQMKLSQHHFNSKKSWSSLGYIYTILVC